MKQFQPRLLRTCKQCCTANRYGSIGNAQARQAGYAGYNRQDKNDAYSSAAAGPSVYRVVRNSTVCDSNLSASNVGVMSAFGIR